MYRSTLGSLRTRLALAIPFATLLFTPSVRAVNMDILCTIQDSHISTLVVTRVGFEPTMSAAVAALRYPSATLLNLQVKESNLRLFAVAKHFNIKLTCATKI